MEEKGNPTTFGTSRASRLTSGAPLQERPAMYTLRTDTASLVLNSQCNGVDVSPLAQLIAVFLTPKPTWTRAISTLHTDESSLRDVQYLNAHHVRELYFKSSATSSCEFSHSALCEAAKLGFLSVVQFLHTNSLSGCEAIHFKHRTYATDRAAKYGHLHVVQWLHENRTEGCSHKAVMGAACNGHLEVVRFLHEVVAREGHAKDDVWTKVVVYGGNSKYDVWNNAASHGQVNVVQYLTDQVRASLRQETQSMHPQWTSEAVEEGVQMELVKWVDTVRPGRTKDEMVRDVARHGFTEMMVYLFLNGFVGDCETAISCAAKHGHLDIIQFFHVQNADGFTANAMDRATKHGHLDIVQFLHENRTEGCTVKAMDQAAKHGHLDIVQFLDTNRHEGCTVEAMDHAAAGGHLDVVQYLHVHRTEGCTSQAMTEGAVNGHLDVVQFLHENRSEGGDDLSEYYGAYDVPMLPYLHTNALIELEPYYFSDACSLESLVYVYDNVVAHLTIDKRLPLVHTVLEGTFYKMDLARIQYLDSKRPRGDVFVSKAMDWAAGSGKLDVLTYLHTHGGHGGCTTAAMNSAASNGRLDIVQFLHHHRTEGCTTAAMNNAATNGHLDIVHFLHHHRSEGCTTAAMDNNWKGRLDIIQFLHENRSEGCTTGAMDTASRHGHLEIVQFLHWNRSEGCTARALENAASMGWLQIAQFLCANRPNESCIVQGLKAARGDKQRYMIDFLKSQLPCACLRCRNPVLLDPHAATADSMWFASSDY